jgi:hypothetical protein
MNDGRRVDTVMVMWCGKQHEITVEGNYPSVHGFGGAASGDPPEAMLRFTCDECGRARFHFIAPDSGWRRPFVVRRVRHEPDER